MAVGFCLRRLARLLLWSTLAAWSCWAQVIEFESGGLRYQTLTKGGLTIMFAELPSNVREYAILQVAISNGSPIAWNVKPDDFLFDSHTGVPLRPTAPRAVVEEMIDKAGRNDVIKLVSAYEMGLYGMSRMNSTNGYERRRQSALAEVASAKLKAAAAASAIAFVNTKLLPGQSTDGALFYLTGGKPIGPGKLLVNAGGERFEFTTTGTTPSSPDSIVK